MDDRKQITVYVLRTPKGHLVRPAVAAVARGGKVRFVNLTQAEALVHLPARALGRRQEIVVLPPQAAEKDRPTKAVVIDVPADAPYGGYAYSVYSDEAHDYCQGESSPIIIIDE